MHDRVGPAVIVTAWGRTMLDRLIYSSLDVGGMVVTNVFSVSHLVSRMRSQFPSQAFATTVCKQSVELWFRFSYPAPVLRCSFRRPRTAIGSHSWPHQCAAARRAVAHGYFGVPWPDVQYAGDVLIDAHIALDLETDDWALKA